MKPSEILVEAKRLLVEKGWTQGAYARDTNGRIVGCPAPDDACFCAYGALVAASIGESFTLHSEAYGYLDIVCGGSVARFNDAKDRTKEEVLAAFDKAIALAKEFGV
jgi:hypothetical protein